MQRSIGPYQVQEEIGRGGMGVVYRATDSRLGREVAIKALPEDLAADSIRLERFEREARSLAQVSHPNIAGIYGVEEQNGKRYLILEFVPGETLADRIDRGPIELDEAIEIACQIAAGVGAAHDAGVIHRDLKPANIRITPDGVVKVLDFGLARQDEGRSSTGVVTHAETITTPAHHHSPTNAGVILGTAAYMSPEQARGRRVDKRTDIWSFGVILYEMLSGASPFIGETATDSIGAVLHKSPDLTKVPDAVRHILERCLDRDKEKRFRDIGDVSIELRHALTAAPAAAQSSARALTFALIAAMVAGAAGVAIGWFAKPTSPARQVHLSVAAPPNMDVLNARLVPTGTTVLLYVRPSGTNERGMALFRHLDSFEPTIIPGSRGGLSPEFSPSGEWLSFLSPVAEGSADRRLVKYAIGKELPTVPIAVLPDSVAISGYNCVWLAENSILFADGRTNQYRVVSVDKGTVGEPIKMDMGEYPGTFDAFLSRVDDTRALCRLFRYASAGYQQDIAVLDTTTNQMSVLLENSAVAETGPDGSLLFSRGSTLYGATLDLEHQRVGAPKQLVAGLRTIGPYQDAFFDVAKDGTLCFRPGGEQGALRRIEIRSPDGTSQALPLEPRPFEEALTISPDESRLLVVVCSPGKLFEIWGTEMDAPRVRRLRGLPTCDMNYPVFAADNDTFVYMRSEGDKVGIEAASFDGRFEPYWVVEPVTNFVAPHSIDPVRNKVLCVWERPEGYGLYTAELKKGSTLTPVFNDTTNRQAAQYSPDGSMLAYLSDESGRDEVYVCTVRDDGSLGRSVAVTTSGAFGLRWETAPESKDGAPATPKPHRLGVSTAEAACVYEVTPGERPRVGPRQVLGLDRSNTVGGWERLSGGRGLCIAKGENEAPATHAEIILNWYDHARALIHGK